MLTRLKICKACQGVGDHGERENPCYRCNGMGVEPPHLVQLDHEPEPTQRDWVWECAEAVELRA